MKQTGIGLIPDDWEVKTLGDVATIIGGGTPSTLNSAYWNGDIQWFTPAELSDSKKYISKSERTITERGLTESSAQLLPKGTVLLTTRASIGLTAILKNPACTNQGFQSLIAKDICCNEFLYYVIPLIKDEMLSRASGSTFAEISAKKLSTITLQLPPLPEQQRIAKALSDVDALISTTEKLIQKKKNIKQGTMQNLLTGKKRLPGFAKSTNYKQSELGLIPEDWEVKNIMDILISSKDKLKIGPFGSQLKKEYLQSNGFYKVFGQENIYSGNFEYCYRFLTKEHFQKLQSCELKPGDFVISTMGTIGKCDIVPENAGVGIMDSHLVRLRLLNSMDKNFFKYFFQSDLIQKQIVALSVGGIMDGLSTAIIKKLNVIEFSKEEQTAIANVLSSMDKEIETLNTKLEKYRNLKTAMMQQLLTGKIRLIK